LECVDYSIESVLGGWKLEAESNFDVKQPSVGVFLLMKSGGVLGK
jgi:hypothetical protein